MKIDRELNQFIGISSLSEKYFSVESEVFLPQVKVCVRRHSLERGADRESLSIGSSTTGIISGNITVLTHSLGRVRWDFDKEWELFLCLSEKYFILWVRNISLFGWQIFKWAGKVSVYLYNIQTKIYMIISFFSNIWWMIMIDIYMINDHIYLYLYHSLSTSMESVEQVGRRERFLQSTFESLSGGIYDI